MAFDQARFDSLLAQAAEYQGAKNAAAAAAGASRSDPAAFMNVGNQLANAVNAYQTGNIADVNKALTQSGLTGQQVATGLNLGVNDILGLEQRGVKFAGPPVTGGITTLTNTGAPGGPGTLNIGPTTTLTNTGAAGGPGTLTAGGNTALTSAASTALPTITLPSNIVSQSANAKASLYNSLLEQGYTDAQIRAAAGTQTDADWNELQRLSKAAPSYSNLINQAYGGIGRTGIGTGTANIDQPGYDYWMSELASGRLTPENFRSTFDTAVDKFIADNPTNVYSQQALAARAPGMFTTAGPGSPQLAGTGTTGTTDLASLNRGFEWAQANQIDETRLKNILGADTYNAYANQYGQGILNVLQPAMADNKLSAEEALDVVTQAKKYGLDASEIAKYTKLNEAVPKAFFDTYDKVVSGIVGNALKSDSTQPEQQRAGSLLALQTKYGISDADIAKYSNGKITEKDATEYLSPIRNFPTDFQNVFNKPDVTAKDISDFIDKSRTKSGVMSFYGDKLNEFDQKLDEMEQKWQRYGTDPLQTEQLYSQIKGITEAAGGKNWSGDWMSGGDNAAMEAAVRLQKKGVDSLKDLKVTPQYTKYDAVELYNGQPIQADEGGKYYLTYNEFIGGNDKTYLPAGAQTQLVFPQLVGGGESGGEYTQYTPLTADELKTYDPKTGKFEMLTGKNLIDGSTGQVISSTMGATNNFVIDTYDTGNLFKGKDKTFGIMMNDAGVPIPYTSTEKTGLVYSPILPIMLAFLAPHLAGYISSALPGAAVTGTAALEAGALGAVPATAANTLASNVLTGGIMGGTTAVARDQDFWKGFGSGALNPLVSYGVGSLMPSFLPSNINPAVARAITGTTSNLITNAITGQGNAGDILKSGILGGATDYALGNVFGSLNLSPETIKLLTGIAIPTAVSGKFNPISAISTLASTAKSAGATR